MTTEPCKHLNKLIQSEPSHSVKAIPTAKIDQNYYDSGAGFILPSSIKDRSWEFKFRQKLEKAGLEPVKVDILALRFVYDMSLREIADEMDFISTTHVLRLLNESTDYLKKIGFGKK